MQKSVAVLGSGSLGSIVAEGIVKDLAGSWRLLGVVARTFSHAQDLAQRTGCVAFADVEAMLHEKPDMVVEAAGVAAAREHAEKILASGSSLILLSCGALADESFVVHLKMLPKGVAPSFTSRAVPLAAMIFCAPWPSDKSSCAQGEKRRP